MPLAEERPILPQLAVSLKMFDPKIFPVISVSDITDGPGPKSRASKGKMTIVGRDERDGQPVHQVAVVSTK